MTVLMQIQTALQHLKDIFPQRIKVKCLNPNHSFECILSVGLKIGPHIHQPQTARLGWTPVLDWRRRLFWGGRKRWANTLSIMFSCIVSAAHFAVCFQTIQCISGCGGCLTGIESASKGHRVSCVLAACCPSAVDLGSGGPWAGVEAFTGFREEISTLCTQHRGGSDTSQVWTGLWEPLVFRTNQALNHLHVLAVTTAAKPL